MDTLIAELSELVKSKVLDWLCGRGLLEVASLTVVQATMTRVGQAAAQAVGAAWREVLVRLAEAVRPCPRCGGRRKLKWRSAQPLRVEVLGFTIELPKLFLECGHCDAPGVSVVTLLTGLSSGEASAQLKLATAYCASAMSYGDSRRDLAVHYGQDLERTRGPAHRVGGGAGRDGFRRDRAARADRAARRRGADRGRPADPDRGRRRKGARRDPRGLRGGTPRRDLPRRKRPSSFREVITMDAREPGETECSALDVLVPAGAPPGERARRMLALAGRVGLGSPHPLHRPRRHGLRAGRCLRRGVLRLPGLVFGTRTGSTAATTSRRCARSSASASTGSPGPLR